MRTLLLSTLFACRDTSDAGCSSACICPVGTVGLAWPARPSEFLPGSISMDNGSWRYLEKDLCSGPNALQAGFYQGPSSFSLPSQPSWVALLRDGWQQWLGFHQELLFQISCSRRHVGWRDEDAGSCLCCLDLLQDRARTHAPQHFWSTAARCTMEIRAWESQRN